VEELPVARLWARADRLFLLPPGLPDAVRDRAARPGLLLGTARPGRFEPSHALALALTRGAAAHAERLEGEELRAFLRGGQVERAGPRGWVLVTYDEWPVGWGRRADGAVLKSRLPRGLRLTPTRWSPEACW
jgi:NOL1/NOP2/fmu family ribosome biogenesis protein